MERQPTSSPRSADWPIITALIVLSLVPLLGGLARLSSLASQAPVTPDNARFFDSPEPVVIHIFSSLIFCVVGAFQFAPGFRKRRPQWHRAAGRWLMLAGVVSALSGLWMTLFYTIPQSLQGPILLSARVVFSLAMIASIVLAWNTIRRKNIAAHRTWMMRAYAIGQGAGTQVIILLPYMLLLGQPDQLTRDILMTVAWVVNLAFVEWLVYRRPVHWLKGAN